MNELVRELRHHDSDMSNNAADQIERLQLTLRECCVALVNADSELSAYGHGRPLSKETALHVSEMCRRSYEAATAAGGRE